MATDIFLKPINRAAQVYTSGPSFQRTHRQQFQYILVYNLYTDVVDDFLADRVKYLIAYRDRLHFLCNQIDSPKLEVDQDVFNQYNRKRVINRKVTFSPISVRMYDTHDGMALKFAKTLYEFEFQNARLYKDTSTNSLSRNKSSVSETYNYEQSVFTSEENFLKSHHYGMRSHESQRHRLLKSIDLYQIAGGRYSKTRMVHPRLQRFDMDTFDFSSSQLVNINLSFNYENLLFEEINLPISDAEYNLTRLFEESSEGLNDTAPPVVNELPEPPDTKLEADVPVQPTNINQSNVNSVATPTTNNITSNKQSPVKVESQRIGSPEVIGLDAEATRDTEEWQQIYNDLNTSPNGQTRIPDSNPQTEANIQANLKAEADKVYNKKVATNQIDPPEDAKGSNYKITHSWEEVEVPQSKNPSSTDTSHSSVSSNTQNVNNPFTKEQLKEQFYREATDNQLALAKAENEKQLNDLRTEIANSTEAQKVRKAELWQMKGDALENNLEYIDREMFSREISDSISGKGSNNYSSISSSYGSLSQDNFLGIGSAGTRTPVGRIKDSQGNVHEVSLTEYNSLKNQLVEKNDVSYK